MINEIREFLSACPYLEGRLININYLGSNAGSISLENVSVRRTVKEYTDGEKLCSARFCLALRQASSRSVSSNIDGVNLPESIAQWLNEQNREGNLPVLCNNRTAVAVICDNSPAVKSGSDMTARHELVFEVRYFQK